VNNGGREGKCFFSCFLCCVGLGAGEASLRFGAVLGALALYTLASSCPLSIIHPPVCQHVSLSLRMCHCALELLWLKIVLAAVSSPPCLQVQETPPPKGLDTQTRTQAFVAQKSRTRTAETTCAHPHTYLCLCSSFCRFCSCGEQMG